ncbi:MAG: PspC domain-containing protein [Myxococcaceae bacterium]|nr:PspC domain-containing protein [Myxococcaceae bacterium]
MNSTAPVAVKKTCPACCEEISRRASRCPHCTSRQPDAALMHRNLRGRVAGGVCAALSLQLGWDATLVRVLFVLSLALSGGLTFWGYALLWVLTPFEAEGQTPVKEGAEWLKGVFSRADAVSDGPPAA